MLLKESLEFAVVHAHSLAQSAYGWGVGNLRAKYFPGRLQLLSVLGGDVSGDIGECARLAGNLLQAKDDQFQGSAFQEEPQGASIVRKTTKSSVGRDVHLGCHPLEGEPLSRGAGPPFLAPRPRKHGNVLAQHPVQPLQVQEDPDVAELLVGVEPHVDVAGDDAEQAVPGSCTSGRTSCRHT